jgi:hypothetical protein
MHGNNEKHEILARKPEENRPHGRPRHGWEYNMRMICRKLVRKVWAGFIWLRMWISGRLFVNIVMNLQVP